jgi:hypothetical protein
MGMTCDDVAQIERPYVNVQNNDDGDAEGIAETARPTLRLWN